MGTPIGRKAGLLMLVAAALVSTPGKRACPAREPAAMCQAFYLC